VKYWQHLYVHHGANVTLVDEHDNHVCGTAGTPKDGALYVLGELEIDDNCSIDHGDIAVYYATSDEATLGRLIGSVAPEQLLYTVYGDFDGDCCVDVDDYDWIVGYLSWYNSRCDWPLADYTGDCLVNASDVAEVLGRYASFTCYSDDACPYQSTSACNFAPGDGPEQGGQESENVEYIPGQPAEGITALASAMVGYLVSRDPQDSGEEDTVQHMIDSFDKLTAMYFDADQKGALADSLEQADYASDTVAELTATLVTKLRG
jgi:hypothetical protein